MGRLRKSVCGIRMESQKTRQPDQKERKRDVMYNPKSLKAEEFISDEEIRETLAYADANKDNIELIDQILAKAKECKGLTHRPNKECNYLEEENVKTAVRKVNILIIVLLTAVSVYAQQHKTMISGKVVSKEKEIIDLATVYLKGTNYGCMTNEQGIYHLHAPAGEYTLVVSAVGYETIEKPVKLFRGERVKMNVVLASSVTELDEVVVVSNGVGRVKRSAFNAVAVDTEELQNSTKNLSDALSKLPGMKLREAGGVGSDTQLMLDGFSGKHVKVFIDGVPQEGVGSSFGLNNIPVNFAERIEVYKGVVPVGFGTDALGGVINIVTNKKKRKWFLDTSYSYGSFNTHKSYVNFVMS